MNIALPNISFFSNDALIKKILEIKKSEQEIISDLVLHIAEIDRREYYRDLGYSSLFSYMTEGLKYSEGGAQRRIRAARALRDNPEIYFKLREGTLTLCTVCEISKVDIRSRSEIILKSEGQSKRAAGGGSTSGKGG